MRKEGNSQARRLYLSGPENRKGVTLEWDDELKVWIKGGTEFFSERKNQWEPLP